MELRERNRFIGSCIDATLIGDIGEGRNKSHQSGSTRFPSPPSLPQSPLSSAQYFNSFNATIRRALVLIGEPTH
jgi:hypothetical protein